MNNEFNEKNEEKVNNIYDSNRNLDIDNINILLSSILTTSAFLNMENIKNIKFLPCKQGYTIEISSDNRKLYMEISEFGYVEIVRENSIDGKIVYMPDDDFTDNNNILDKDIYTIDQAPWVEYLEIDEETGERKLKSDTPKEIVQKYNEFLDTVKNKDNERIGNANSSINNIKNFFHLDSKNNKDVIKFAQEQGYKGAKYIGNWKEYKVYEPYMDDKQVSYIGLPLVILVNANGEIRMSTSDEAMATLDDNSFMESYEENRILETTRLKRELLINIKNDFINKRNEYKFSSMPNNLYLDYLEKIETLLNNYGFESDARFINKNISNINWVSNDDAINYLFDNIMGNILIIPNDVPYGQNLSNVSFQLEQYYKDGYVCSEEKEMLLNIINKIKEYIKSSNG